MALNNPELKKGLLYKCIYVGQTDKKRNLRNFGIYLARVARFKSHEVPTVYVRGTPLLDAIKIYEYRTFTYPFLFIDFDGFNDLFKVLGQVWPE